MKKGFSESTFGFWVETGLWCLLLVFVVFVFKVLLEYIDVVV